LYSNHLGLNFIPIVTSALAQTQQFVTFAIEDSSPITEAKAIRLYSVTDRDSVQDEFQGVRINHGWSFT
jgi:hypothetical protein